MPPGITSPIIATYNGQLEDNLKTLDFEVTAEDMAKVDELVPPGTFVSSYYNADFGPHEYRV